ncbi:MULTISPECIES: zinc-dependent alcohol dehydrogenase [Dyadobacter]|uniref:Glutathione-dependent formaldehyde dehydrogenase n=1 Tax=Dyadobacter chenhuakuii TaxID=2909339 RepID=A0A9X1QB25_9BACT|nr:MULTISPECIES: zinc-dependent alcohol dehydrogenase [Dyadobacter]MCE7070046.1 glutathione-dependent formaldehyde dehydrogenase [Dyadobacter sp. CY327]MCF2492376.1 glutathione-dependent formaldehyde dehydrogenase [Dyadobacter chenhuakuii]MCF2497202.1 glutathione-dependent formaldehyde dehydrogenase [Dyadobacter chenhuakuii]USJ33321.1 glutathione-dependent formaldehyde dehydrogenase [Dyadobacter chenhuakuii]
MLAMNYRGPYRVRADRNKPMPEIEHSGDAIVRVTRSCICGSDLHLYHGLVPDTRVGTTFGHEFIGVVEEIGDSVQNLKVGDTVLVPFNIACGKCVFCQQGLYGNCHESNPEATAVGGIFGYSHTAGGFDGGQAEYVRVPYADFGPTLIPEDMDHDDAVLLTDVVPTGYQAAEMAGIKPGDTVVVFGAGPIGIMAAKSAWLFGAGRVIVIDHIEYRLEFVKQYAQCEAYNFRSLEDPVLFIKKTTDWIGADVCIDAVGCEAAGDALQTITGRKLMLQAGSATALHWAINAVKKGGIVSIVGVYGPTGNLIPIGNVVNKGITIRANQASVKRLLPRLIEHVQAGRLDPKGIITHRIPLEEVGDAYHIFSAKLDNCIKTILIPPSARK